MLFGVCWLSFKMEDFSFYVSHFMPHVSLGWQADVFSLTLYGVLEQSDLVPGRAEKEDLGVVSLMSIQLPSKNEFPENKGMYRSLSLRKWYSNIIKLEFNNNPDNW